MSLVKVVTKVLVMLVTKVTFSTLVPWYLSLVLRLLVHPGHLQFRCWSLGGNHYDCYLSQTPKGSLIDNLR